MIITTIIFQGLILWLPVFGPLLAHTDFSSWGTRAQHLTLSVWCLVFVWCVCDVWCPLDGCDALIGQQDNCTVTVSVYSCTVHVYTQHGHNIVMNRAGILA